MSKENIKLSDINLLDPSLQENPYEAYSVLRSKAPVFLSPETGFYVVSKYNDLKRVLTDYEYFSRDLSAYWEEGIKEENKKNGYWRYGDKVKKIFIEKGWRQIPCFDAEPPYHTKFRKAANPSFTAGRIKKLEPYIESLINELIDTFIDDGNYQDGSGMGDFPISYIASDNVLGGKMAARALAKAIGEKGKVYVSNVRPGISTTDQREEGFKMEIQNYPNITLLNTQYNDDDANKASAQLQAVAARNQDIAGVFGANLFSAIGAADGVKTLGKSGQIKVVAFDAPSRIVDDINSGLIDLAIAQHPAEIGYYGVMTAYAVLMKQSVPISIGTGFTVMDKSNISDPEISKYVYSD